MGKTVPLIVTYQWPPQSSHAVCTLLLATYSQILTHYFLKGLPSEMERGMKVVSL